MQPVAHRVSLALCLALAVMGCAATLTQAEATALRKQLRDAMQAPVKTLAERDQHSRLLADVVGKDALHGLNQLDVRTAFGPGDACRKPLCGQHGFTDSDWYYEIGRAEDPKIKQLPVLIVGFDPQLRAARIWTLTTH